jgi:uncharacterized protein (DUF1501 family)
MHPSYTLSRRSALLGLAAAASLGRVHLALAAAPTDQRFVVVLLRGALDGLAAVQPYGDPALRDLRPNLALGEPGTEGGVLDLGGQFGLHPALAGLHALYGAGELLPIHAVAGPVRSRSHFEAQDILESGADHRLTSGWLNRAVEAMPGQTERALAVGTQTPLLLRGPAPVAAYAPHAFAQPTPDLYAQVAALAETDPVLGPATRAGLRERAFNQGHLGDGTASATPDRNAFPTLARTAGQLLAAPGGPRVAALELGGWDTHAAQANRLEAALRTLDGGLVALKDGLGLAWARTAVLVVTEFGRTARANGTNGTDHGTAGCAFLSGGAVRGGRVLADWPGLGTGKLYEDRDLAPTLDVRAVAKGVLADHLGLPPAALLAAFPGGGGAEPVRGLMRG